MNLSEYAKILYNSEDFKRMSSLTQRDYKLILGRFCEFLGEDFDLEKITKFQIQNFLNSLKVCFTTHNKYHRYLKAFFNKAIEIDLLTKNPVVNFLRRKPDRNKGEIPSEKVPRSVSPAQLQFLLSKFKKHAQFKYYLLTKLLIESGCRISEALNVKKTELYANYIYLPITKNGSPRFIYFSSELGSQLKKLASTNQSDYLFCGENTKEPLKYHIYKTVFNNMRDGIVNKYTGKLVTIHGIRHSFATMRVGVIDALELKELMGHESLNTTLRYITASQNRIEEAYKKTEYLLVK